MKNRFIYILSGIIIYMCVGSIYSWSVFRKPLEQLLDINATLSGTPYMLFLLFFSFTMPFAGSVMQKLKPFKTILIGNIFFIVGFLLSGFFQKIFYISIGYGIISGIGVGMIYGVPIAVVSKWLPERKGLAMGLTLAGFGLSPFVTAPLIQNLINLHGPFNTFKILGLLFFIVIFILSIPMKFPDENETIIKGQATEKEKQTEYSLKEIIKKKEFYGLWFCYTIGTLSGLLAIGISSPFAQEALGISAVDAAFFVSFFAIFNGLGRPLFGFLTDRLKPFKTIIISFLILLFASFSGIFINKTGIFLFVMVFSFLWMILGGWLAIAPATTSMLFGSKNYPVNYGVVFTAYGAGAVAGNILSGVIKDLSGSYVFVFYPIIIMSIIGIFIAFMTFRTAKNAI